MYGGTGKTIRWAGRSNPPQMHNCDITKIINISSWAQQVGMLTPRTQRSPQHSESTSQDSRRGLHSPFGFPLPRASRVSPLGAAAANVTKATARRMVDLKNCMVTGLRMEG